MNFDQQRLTDVLTDINEADIMCVDLALELKGENQTIMFNIVKKFAKYIQYTNELTQSYIQANENAKGNLHEIKRLRKIIEDNGLEL